KVEVFRGSVSTSSVAASPGQHELHYAPRTATYRFEPGQRRSIVMEGNAVLAMGKTSQLEKRGDVILMPSDPASYAYHLYSMLRQLDSMDLRAIYIEMPPDSAEWAAIRDRLTRASKALE